ncbi:hypothetical protein WJM97_13505 [Okeanomitos corallinicola TIOX110]|uniref:Uncharacterized protein n=1 Tax=Okeanomitos corallinicola TIOX110 TaxID=3133117 RepID=A0ABZ2UM20_9CYAN
MVLILILGQIIFLGAILGVIFFIIDRVIETFRKPKFSLKRRHNWMGIKRIFFKARNNNFSQPAKINYKHPLVAGLWHKLLVRVHFDTLLAERLVNHLKIRYPGKSDRWYIEKAIYDLERDRY